MFDIVSGKVTIASLRQVEIQDLLRCGWRNKWWHQQVVW
jgi:hypothetical protein